MKTAQKTQKWKFVFLLSLASTAHAATVSETFQQLSSRDLRLVKTIPLYRDDFKTYHPQGIKVNGSQMFLTSVEGKSEGHGYLTQYELTDSAATPVKQIQFDAHEQGMALNHAGGVDGDHESLYIPLAAYRKVGPAKILKVDLKDLSFKTIGEVADHVGALISEIGSGGFKLFNWGARDVYTTDAELSEDTKDKSSGWQYQDCKSIGDREAICSAKKGLIRPRGQIHLIRFNEAGEKASFQIVKRIRVPHIRPDGSRGGRRPVTYNAMDFEMLENGMRFYFVPHDQQDSHLIIMDALGADKD